MKIRLAVLDRAVEKTMSWVRDLGADLGWIDPNPTWSGLRAVLHALRDRLMPDEARDLGTQLPLVIRGAYFEGWTPHATPTSERTQEDFLARVAEAAGNLPQVDPEALTRAVFRLLTRRVTAGEIKDVRGILPRPIEELWPTPAETAGVEEVFQERQEAGVFEKRRTGATTGRSKIRRARREIRGAVARARAAGVPERELPILTPRGKVRQDALRRRSARRGQA